MKTMVEADRMLAAARAIRDVTNRLRDNMDAMEMLVDNLSGDWQGDAERACAVRFHCVRREFREVEHFFEEYALLLGRFAEEYRDYEEELAAKIRTV